MTRTTSKPLDASDPVDSTQEPMAKVRPGAPAGERLARARLLGALFGHDGAAGSFGRFRVLDRLGAGGMGVVYEAYDPDLARAVALKLVDVARRDREVALAEAKALARLSHPNVVLIYDVGIDGDHVYLVMELVRGRALDQWPEGTKSHEILEAYRQAGAALAAAHAAGLVHRDFKPANALIGADGRVRVIDFGLACEADEQDHSGARRGAAGTKGFMAPEIAAGAAVTPAADQYSFCVALAGTLELTKVPLPRWIKAALDRGRAAEPKDRYASMNELLRALARDPARARRRIIGLGGIAASIGAIAFLVGQRSTASWAWSQGRTTSDALAVCDEGAAELEAAWPATARRAALDRVTERFDDGPSLRLRFERDLDQYMIRWAEENRAACRDWRRGTQPEVLTSVRLACLRRGRRAFEDIGQALTRATPEILPQLQTAILSMTDPARCADVALDSFEIEPPPTATAPEIEQVRDRLEQARTRMDLGNHSDAERVAEAAVMDARRLHYAPLLAESLLLLGHARMATDAKKAVAPLHEATTVAIRARMDAVAVEAWARRVYAQKTTSKPNHVLSDLEIIRALADRSRSAEFARALLYNNLGTVALTDGDRDTARKHFETAELLSLGIKGRRDRRRLELLAARANLVRVTDDRAAGDQHLREVERELTDLLGERHPQTLRVRWMRGTVTIERLADALTILVPVCEGYQRHAMAERLACWMEVGLLYLDLDRYQDAHDAFARASGLSTKSVSPSRVYLALASSADPGTAAAELAGKIAEQPLPEEQWWVRYERAELRLALGRALHTQRRLREARDTLQTAVSELAEIARAHPTVRHERQLGRARIYLALVLSSLQAPPREIEPIAIAARAWLQRVEGSQAQLSKLSALTVH
jgi:eukaryotic-like serine/threonine-protein kinase